MMNWLTLLLGKGNLPLYGFDTYEALKAYRKLEGYASLARSPFLPPAVAADLRAQTGPSLFIKREQRTAGGASLIGVKAAGRVLPGVGTGTG